ncbi:MAG: ATP-binding cassette domain-containing protein [Cyclobacteriaceae bacterium]|nr:ATP-binding cassette domain-containing protein [Cyclobacteriaceae bacterium]
MSEELLKAIVQLFAIVARERITEDERNNIREFLGFHLNRDSVKFYLNLFEEYAAKQPQPGTGLDAETQLFVDEWSRIMQISRQVNQSLTRQQKLVLIIKIIELVYADGHISERQENLIYYIGQALKIPRHEVEQLRRFVTGHDRDELASPHVLIIDEGYGDAPYPGPHIVEKNINGLIAILKLDDSYFIKYLGISVLYLNGIPMKSRKVDVLPAGSTIRGDKIEPIYYSDIIGKFLAAINRPKISFVAEHLFYHFKSGRAGLQNINIAEQGGKLVGIMGASGSGKSTLLSVLNGSSPPSSGRVRLNGVDIYAEPEKVQGLIGYVPQDDLLIEDLTVFENLYFNARLCCLEEGTEQTIEKVDKLLHQLGLYEIRNLKVGSPLDKVISGGQRKRLNIGLELLREPWVLFVDEPTSGLSSRDSENIMDLLKELALRGKLVFVVIHQPSSDIFKMFDTLIILDVGGFQIYYGNPVESVIYFREIINAANKTQGACPVCGNINPEQVFNIIETRIVNEYGRLTNARKISPGQWYQYFKQRIRLPKPPSEPGALPPAVPVANRWRQLAVFLLRDLKSKWANRQYMLATFLEAPVLAFFIGYMVKYFNVLEEEGASYTFFANSNIPVFFFMSVVVALFLGLIVSAEEIYRDRKILKREQFLHLSRLSYLASKIVILFTLSAIQTFSFVLIAHTILEIPLSEFRYWFILFTVSCFANLLGLNISASFKSAVTIYILIPLLVIPQLLLSGVVIAFDRFNPNVSEPVGVPLMGDLMATRWAFEAYMVTQFRDNPYEKAVYEWDKIAAQAEFKRTYLIPELESRLSLCYNNPEHWRNAGNEELARAIQILRTELEYELRYFGEEKFPMIKQLMPGNFSAVLYDSTRTFLMRLRNYYTFKQNRALKAREEYIAARTSTPADAEAFQALRSKYVNQAVTDWVKNAGTVQRIVEYNGRLVQKYYPIYQDEHRPRHFLDYDANFYQPVKHFAGRKFDTLWFNLAVVWIMTFLLSVTLYFDLLHRLVVWVENRKYYRRRLI